MRVSLSDLPIFTASRDVSVPYTPTSRGHFTAQDLSYLKTDRRVLAYEARQVFTTDKYEGRRSSGLGRKFVRPAGYARAETQDFPWLGDVQQKLPALSRGK